MRVTQNGIYNAFIKDQQSVKSELDTVNRQLSSGIKIKYGYEDPQVFADTLRLDYEEHTLNEAIDVSTDAQVFANNTDSAMSQMTDTLNRFKTLMVQAGNGGTNGEANYFAISNELKGLKEHMITLGNTSINGRFLFAGSALDVKPVDSEGRYRGNDKQIKAIVGDNVQLAYNIPGSELFLGEDKTYARKISTNVQLHKLIDPAKKDDPDAVDKRPVPAQTVQVSDTVESLTGWDTTSYFYLSGRKHDGTGFKKVISLDADATVDHLLQEIGKAYGNSSTSAMVDVRLENGNIVIKDKLKGSSLLDFSMVASDEKVTDIKDLVEGSSAHVLLFDRGGRVPEYSVETLKSVRRPERKDTFDLKTLFIDNHSQKPAFYTTKLRDVFADYDYGADITLSGTDVEGNSVSTTVSIDDVNTVSTLTDAIRDTFGVEVSLGSDGRLEMTDATDNKGENFSLSMAVDNDDKPSFRTEVLPERNEFAVSGARLFSDVSQIDKRDNSFAVGATRVVDTVADTKLDNYSVMIDAVDVNGSRVRGEIFHDSDNVMKLRVDSNNDGSWDKTLNIKNADGSDTTEDSTANPPIHQFTMRQFTDAVSLVLSGEYANASADYAGAVEASQAKAHVALDSKGRVYVEDKTSPQTQMRLSLYDGSADDYTRRNLVSFQSNNALTVDDPHTDMFETLQMAIDAVENGYQFPDGSQQAFARNPGFENLMERLDHLLEHVSKEHTRVGAISNTLQSTVERSEVLKINVQSLRSDILDTDIAEASIRLSQLSLNYQAMMSTITRIQKLSLVNYM